MTGFFILIGCQLLGESLRREFGLPVPGPVIGMLLLAGILVVLGERLPTDVAGERSLDDVAGLLVRHMGLLFVPAGVGIIAEASVLRGAWLPLAAGLVGSTVLSLLASGMVMHRVGRRATARAEAAR